jgi:hypothetical protein
VITLADAKADLRVRHDGDDVLILRLIDSAVDECLRFMNRDTLPAIAEPQESGSSESEDDADGPVAPSVRAAVFLLVQAGYDRMKPDEVQMRRHRAEVLCMPYRRELGV